MDNVSEDKMGGLARYRAQDPIELDAFTALIRKKAEARESSLSSKTPEVTSWNLGFVSRRGNVRKRNEDFGTAFNHRNHQVMIVGDGLGGPSHGHLASFIAVEAASQVILDQLRDGMTPSELQKVCSSALWTAGHQLAWGGDKLNVLQSGLRTTLIMVIANQEYAVLTYIGDGAVYHYKSLDDCASVLFAQKAVPGNLSLLAASLGPTAHGKPRARRLTRTESDLIVVMTDGIADRIQESYRSDHPPELIANLIRLAVQRDGDLQKVAEEAAAVLVEEQDEKGYLCDDNISLGFIGNHKSPRIL